MGRKSDRKLFFFTTAPFVAEVGFEPTGSFWERLAYETSKLGHYLTPRYKTSFLLSNIRVFFFPRNVYGCCIKRTTVKSYSTAFHVGPAGIEPTSSDFQSAALTTSATTPKKYIEILQVNCFCVTKSDISRLTLLSLAAKSQRLSPILHIITFFIDRRCACFCT